MHEAQMHQQNCFVTLTYNNINAPEDFSLNHHHFVLFMRRLRKWAKKEIRFYMCGEYGEKTSRPHFHACLFGIDFADRYYWSKGPSGSKNYRSPTLEKLWTQGNSLVGDITFESAAYTARYIMKKITFKNQTREERKNREIINPETAEITTRKQEYNQMSRKTGIGKTWLKKYAADVYPEGKVIVRGHPTNSPRYYDQHFKKLDPDGHELMLYGRHLEAVLRAADNTERRDQAKEKVAIAKVGLLKRTID